MAETIAEIVTIQGCSLDAALNYSPPIVKKGGVLRGTIIQCVNCTSHAGAKPIAVTLEQVPNVTRGGKGPVNTLTCPDGTDCVGHTPNAQVMNVMPRTK